MEVRYSFEEIYYNLDIARDCLSDGFRSCVCKALSLLNKKIVNKVSNSVLFISSDTAGGMCIPLNSDYTKGRRAIIFLSESLLENEEKEILKAILHEVAHFYLKHGINTDLSKEEIDKKEQDADTLALEWLNINRSP